MEGRAHSGGGTAKGVCILGSFGFWGHPHFCAAGRGRRRVREGDHKHKQAGRQAGSHVTGL